MRRIRDHLSYANVISTLCLFLLLTGGTAVALTGSNTVFTDDIANDTQPASGGNPAGGLTAADLRPNSVGSSEVTNFSLGNGDFLTGSVNSRVVTDNELTGADIADQSGVDTCVSTVRLGSLCVRAENTARSWANAQAHCANLDLRMPTLGEALQLAQTHDIPNVDQNELFWTDEATMTPEGGGVFTFSAYLVSDAGSGGTLDHQTDPHETVCVMTPTN
jgi:hypothetical protein